MNFFPCSAHHFRGTPLTTHLHIPRLSCLLPRLRNRQNNLQYHGYRCKRRHAHLSHSVHSRPAPPRQHRHPRRYHHALHAPHRAHLGRRTLHLRTSTSPRTVHPAAPAGVQPNDERTLRLPADPRPVCAQGRHFRRAEACELAHALGLGCWSSARH